MESYLNNNTKKSLNDITNYIKESDDYKKCISLRSKMEEDKSLLELIEEVKCLQKKYIREENNTIKEELDEKVDLLNSNKTYTEYNYYLDKVNIKLDFIKEELNNYFMNLVDIDFN